MINILTVVDPSSLNNCLQFNSDWVNELKARLLFQSEGTFSKNITA